MIATPVTRVAAALLLWPVLAATAANAASSADGVSPREGASSSPAALSPDAARADAPPASDAAPAPDAARIIELATAQPGRRVRFEERRLNAMLDEPMVFTGYVSMAEDGTLVRVVEQPFAEKATINGNQATLERDGQFRRVNLDRAGGAGAYLKMLYALLRGDLATLQRRFELAVSGDHEQWQLTLTPGERALQRRLERMVVSGSGEFVQGIRMERANGDWQEMRLLREAS